MIQQFHFPKELKVESQREGKMMIKAMGKLIFYLSRRDLRLSLDCEKPVEGEERERCVKQGPEVGEGWGVHSTDAE